MKTLLFTCLMFCFAHCYSQEIGILGRRYGQDSLVIRWAPLNYEHWFSCKKHEHKLEIFEYHQTPKLVWKRSMELTRKEDWNIQHNSDPLKQLAFEAIFHEAATIEGISLSNDPNKQSYSLLLLAADLSSKVANHCGLRSVFYNPEKGQDYIARITCETEKTPLSGVRFLGVNNSILMYDIPNIQVQQYANGIGVHFSHIPSTYIAYNIIRKEEGKKSGVQINKLPVLPIKNNKDHFSVQFLDTTTVLGRTYEYQIEGIDNFGDSQRSTFIAKVVYNKHVVDLPQIVNHQIDERETCFQLDNPTEGKTFEAYVSDEMYHKYERQEISSMQGSRFCLPKIIHSKYIKLIHPTNRQSESLPYYLHLVDTIPPEEPMNFQVQLLKNGYKLLTWSPNPEPDFNSYIISKRQKGTSRFTPLSGESLKDTFYIELDTFHFDGEEFEYQLQAEDKSYNTSPPSRVNVKSIDTIPPVPAIITSASISNKGIIIQWKSDPSEQCSSYLYRRTTGNELWELITKSQLSITEYIDTSIENNEAYEYIILSKDSSGNESLSSPIYRRYHKVIQPEYETVISALTSKDRKFIRLEWEKGKIDTATYELFRSEDGDTYYLLKTTSNHFFDDHKLKRNKLYYYKVRVVDSSGKNGPFSQPIKLKYR